MMRERWRLYALDRGGLLALCVLLMYAWLAPVHVVDGDNAEFATLGAMGGAAHPSGYPLYVLWLRATSWIPAASPAHAAALATAMVGAAGALVLHAACRAWGARPLAATATVAVFAASPIALRFATEAEAFALNNLVVAAVLWLAARHGPLTGGKRAAALGLVAGLGLANHLTCALVAPVGILGVMRAAREARRAWIAVVLAAFALAIGLLPYAYLFVAPDTPMSWGAVRNLDGLVAMMTRRDYGGPTAFRVAAVDVPARESIAALAMTLGRTWLWLPALAGVAMLARAAARGRGPETRSGWAMLALAWLVAGPLLALRFNVPPRGLGLYVCQRFHILPALLLAPAVAVALDPLAARAETRTNILAALLATGGFAALTSLSLPYLAGVHGPAVELAAKNMLRSLPPNAIVIHGQDELHAVTGYAQWALGIRQDVDVITEPLLGARWYRERSYRRDTLPEREATNSRRIAEYNLARGRPVFVDRLQRDIIRTFPTYPYGVLIRVLPRGTSVPDVHEVLELNRRIFADFAMDYPRPAEADEFAAEAHRRYSAVWAMIARKLSEDGDASNAAWAVEMARRFAPR